MSLKMLHDYCDAPDIIMLNNVLNVIQEDFVLVDVLKQTYDFAGENTDVYITIYEGNKSGVGKATSKGYQRNSKANEYKGYIGEYFDIVCTIKGNILKCIKIV